MIRAHVGNSQHIQRNIREILPIHPSTLVTTIYPSHALGIPFPRKTSEPLQILHVGRIAPGKGHLDAIQACLEGLFSSGERTVRRLNDFLEKGDRSQELVFICRSGGRSGQATAESKKLGYKWSANMLGGMLRWNELQYTTEKNKED